jgi:type 1 fimbria pilin
MKGSTIQGGYDYSNRTTMDPLALSLCPNMGHIIANASYDDSSPDNSSSEDLSDEDSNCTSKFPTNRAGNQHLNRTSNPSKFPISRAGNQHSSRTSNSSGTPTIRGEIQHLNRSSNSSKFPIIRGKKSAAAPDFRYGKILPTDVANECYDDSSSEDLDSAFNSSKYPNNRAGNQHLNRSSNSSGAPTNRVGIQHLNRSSKSSGAPNTQATYNSNIHSPQSTKNLSFSARNIQINAEKIDIHQ